MLTAAQFDALITPLLELYELYTGSVINDIARRLAKTGRIASTAAWQMQRLIESGKVYESALAELSRISKKSESLLRQMFYDAGVKSTKFDDSIYTAAGLNPIPLHLSPSSLNVLLAGLRKTSGVVHNLTMTTAIDARNTFIAASDLAYMQVANGAMGYDQAIRSAIKTLAQNGISTVSYPSGHRDQLDVAVRRSALTGVTQTAGALSMSRIEDMGIDLIQTSAHIGARPEHELWQGRIFSKSGSSAKHPNFEESTGYGTVTGLCGVNCRHSFYPFFEGISENAYTQATLDEYADKAVTYNGKEISVYDGTQAQRAIERRIRNVKREANALSAASLDNSKEIMKIRGLQSRMRDFINQTGLARSPGREGGRALRFQP